MSRTSFANRIVISWGLVACGAYIGGKVNWWLGVPLLVSAVALFYAACRRRSEVTCQPRTAQTASMVYAAGIVLSPFGFALKYLFHAPHAVALVVEVAGVWSVGGAWTCALALWYGSWYVTR